MYTQTHTHIYIYIYIYQYICIIGSAFTYFLTVRKRYVLLLYLCRKCILYFSTCAYNVFVYLCVLPVWNMYGLLPTCANKSHVYFCTCADNVCSYFSTCA